MASDRLQHAKEVSCDTAASPEEVFAVIADGWLYPTWVVGASRMRAVDPAWPTPGASLHHSVGVWPMLINDTTTVLECQLPTLIRLRAKGWPVGEAEVEITVRAQPDGSVLTITEDAVRGPGALVPRPVRQALFGPRNVETLKRLAMLAEGRSRRPLGGHDPTRRWGPDQR